MTVAIDTGSSAVLTPRVNWAYVELVDSADNVLASSGSTVAGRFVTLEGVTIPVDGTYRVRINAPGSHLSATGNYLATLWDVTADVYGLVLNRQHTGQIENPYSVDKWEFSATDGTQVRFDLVNQSASSIAFDLTGVFLEG